jgi:hypothetical protein
MQLQSYALARRSRQTVHDIAFDWVVDVTGTVICSVILYPVWLLINALVPFELYFVTHTVVPFRGHLVFLQLCLQLLQTNSQHLVADSIESKSLQFTMKQTAQDPQRVAIANGNRWQTHATVSGERSLFSGKRLHANEMPCMGCDCHGSV